MIIFFQTLQKPESLTYALAKVWQAFGSFSSGIIGTDFKTIDYDIISDIEVTVSVVEKMYNVVSIRFFSGRT